MLDIITKENITELNVDAGQKKLPRMQHGRQEIQKRG